MQFLENKKLSIEYNTRLTGYISNSGSVPYVVSLNGKFKTKHIKCPQCKQLCYVDNGYHAVTQSIITSLGLNIKVSQFNCKKCNLYWSTERELVDQVVTKIKELTKSLMLGCVRVGLSLEKSVKLIHEQTGIKYSPQHLHKMYVNLLSKVNVEKFSDASGVYIYDEQYLLVNGKEVCRLTVKDAVTGKVIIDVQTADAKKETIKQVLQQALEGLSVDAFIIDMRQVYPELLRELFPKAKIQWCIFHLYKLVWKELRDEYGKKIPLHELYNVYTLFNIFFNHEVELEKLKVLMQKFEQMKTKDEKSNSELEKALRKEFAKFVKELKKQRRRDKQNVPRRTLEESEEKFTDVYKMLGLYPNKLQKRISFIRENWERFTLFQRNLKVQPTSNGIEQYFAATLSKTDKKNFRSTAAVNRELNAFQAEWNGQSLLSKTSLVEVLSLVGMLFVAFPPPW